MSYGSNDDGWLISLLHFCCQEFGYTVEYVIDDISAVMALLLVRQKLTVENKIGITLKQKEMIDSTDWEDMLRQNREQVSRQLKSL